VCELPAQQSEVSMAKLYICETFVDTQYPKNAQLVDKSAHEQLREYLQSFDGEIHLETAFERKDGTVVAILWTEDANEV
jgi:hypothetical protein